MSRLKKHSFLSKRIFAAQLNDQGFTLVETLFAFSVFLIIVFFISPLFQIMLANRDLNIHLQKMEWDVFCSQIKFELHSSLNVVIASEDKLIITSNEGTITYERYNNTLRRQVYETGHEILLQHVAKVAFSPIKNGVIVTVTDLTGQDYRVTVHSFLDWRANP